MPDITLTEQEVQTLLRCLNDRVEPPEALAKKLFPKLYAGFDFKTLNRASIPTIEYAGKRSEAAILNEASAFGAGSPLQIVRFFRGGKFQKDAQQLELIKETGPTWDTGWKNMIVQGDNLQFLKTCFLDQDPLIKGKVKGKVKLVYMDPPFATKSGLSGQERRGQLQLTRWTAQSSLNPCGRRLIFIREILAEDGSLYVHLDPKMSHYMKVVLDEIFGPGSMLGTRSSGTTSNTIRKGNTNTATSAIGIDDIAVLSYSRSRCTKLHISQTITERTVGKHWQADHKRRAFGAHSEQTPIGDRRGN